MIKDINSDQVRALLPGLITGHTESQAFLELEGPSKQGLRSICYREPSKSQMLATLGYSWLECVVKTAASLYQQDVISQSEHSQIIEKALSQVGYKVNDKRI